MTSMLFTIFCCFASCLVVYCVLKRVNQRTVELAIHSAVHDVKKEFQTRNATMVAQLAAKERELAKARELVKLHEIVPTAESAPTPPAPAAQGVKRPREGLDLFAMSRPFTDTSFDALMAATDVVRVEPVES